MKRMALLILMSAALRGDTLVFTSANWINYDVDACDGGGYGCSPLDMSIPQFDPRLGTLTSVTWTFTDSQAYYGGYNDMYDPLTGDPFTWTTTEGDQSGMLGLDASNSQFNSAVTCGCRQISMGGWWGYDTVQATGTVPNDSPFIGTGMLDFPITPFVSASFPTSSNGWVQAAILFTEDSETLTVTETYTTPEPRGAAIALGAAFLILLIRPTHRRHPRSGNPQSSLHP